MTAVVVVVGALVVGFGVGYVLAARETEAHADQRFRDELTRQWREGATYGEAKGHAEGEAKGYADGWTSGRIALVGEQEAKRHHPTGSPLSHLRALDAEADRQMGGE